MRKTEIPKEVEEEVEVTESEEVAKAVRQDKNTMPYVSASSCPPIGAVVPTKLAYETLESLNKYILNGIDTANLIKDKLKYNSRLAVCDAFSNEQCDAIALAIDQIEKGKGFILGDMAGIGKGRVCAGILRYAKVNGKIPVFITIASSLFSAMWNDIADIGGIDNAGNTPTPFIFNADGKIEKRINGTLTTIYVPSKTAVTVEFCRRKEMPVNNDMVMLTYSQLSQDTENAKNANGIAKTEFLQAISSNAIFVLDESHKGAGAGNLAKNIADIISTSHGVMFSSATYAKVPKSMMLYIPKTDINDSNIRPKTIVEAVRENGEAVQEYIASQIVKSGQMIRRERTFDGCKIEYEYMNKSMKPKYYALYDNVMNLYNEIEAFSKSSLYKDAVEYAIIRYAKDNGVRIIDPNDRKPANEEDKNAWKERNKDKYNVTFNTLAVVTGRFQWTENLLFSIKATYVADQTIELLRKRDMVEYIDGDKRVKKETNYKPIIAVRNTAESSLNTLGYKAGDVISPADNDYAKTLINVVKSLTTSSLEFTPVVASKDKKEIIIEDASVSTQDFSDGGVRYNEILNKIEGSVSGLPLSPIDHMITKIENAVREQWDYDYTNSKTYKVDEITKRQLTIKPTTDANGKPIVDKDGNYVAFNVSKIPFSSAVSKVDRYNAGEADVLILNTAGSTGLSMHSKFDFIDKRPRVMLIHQVELDVATETQKRGRINRTGQVNKPAYTYIVSVVPSEVRKLLMLRRKLRSLDANTTGNVKQSAKASQILDAEGNEIEDMCNKYGFMILESFKAEAGNEEFANLVSEKWWTGSQTPDEKFEGFLREVEKLPCITQEKFYNGMNAAYSKFKKEKEEAGEWDLETSIENLNASTFNKKVLFYGNDKNEFTKSVYIEDKWVTPKKKPYSKEEVQNKIEELCKGKSPIEYHNLLMDDFELYGNKILADVREYYGEPDTSNAKDEEEAKEIIKEHKLKVEIAIESNKEKLGVTQSLLQWFVPKKAVQIPLDVDSLIDGYLTEQKDRKSIPYITGYFVGYKINATADNRYSPMNIELEFASTSRIRPFLRITFTKQYENIYRWMIGGRLSPIELAFLSEWNVKSTDERDIMRILTGELFKAFEITDDLFKKDANYESGRKRLIKYTTASGSIETGVRLFEKKHISLTVGKTPTFAPINSDEFMMVINDAKSSGDNKVIFLPSLNDMIYVHSDGSFTFGVCTGKHGKRTTPDKKNNYLSDWATTEFAEDFTENTGLKLTAKRFDLRMEASGNSKWIWNMEFLGVQVDKSYLSDILDYLYKKYKVLMPLKSSEGEYIIREMADKFIESSAKEEEEGVYDYYPQITFDESNPPPNYIKGSFQPSPENSKGIIALKFSMSVIESALYKMIPANISEQQAVKNIMKQIGDEKKLMQFIRDVKDLKDDYLAVAIMTQNTIGVPPKYAIGDVDAYAAGEIIANNIDVKSDDKPSKKVEQKSKKEQERIPLNWETAQDFIMQMKSL